MNKFILKLQCASIILILFGVFQPAYSQKFNKSGIMRDNYKISDTPLLQNSKSDFKLQANLDKPGILISDKNLSYKVIDTVQFIQQFMAWYGINKPFDYNADAAIYSYVTTSQDITNDRNLYVRTSTDLNAWSARVPIFIAGSLTDLPIYSSIKTVKKGNDLFGLLSSGMQINNDIVNVEGFANLTNPSTPKKYTSASFTNNGNLYDYEGDNCFAAGLTNQNEFYSISLTKGIITNTSNKVSTFPVTTIKDANTPTWETKMVSNLTSKWFVESNGVTESIPLGTSQTKDRVYFSMLGQFIDDNNVLPTFLNFGFSYTEDYGKSWSEPQKTTKKLFEDFLKSYNVIKDSISIFSAGNHKGFTALDNGNVYFVTELTYKTAQSGWTQMIVEVYYENDAWGIRQISNTTGSSYVVYQVNENNQLAPAINNASNEIQISKTADNQYLVSKWLEGSYYTATHSTGAQVYCSKTQIKVATRKIGESGWKIINLTDGRGFDRYYFLPSVLPNDLSGIPIFSLRSSYLGTDKSAVDSNITAERIDLPNYLCVSKFNIDPNSKAPRISCATNAINFDTMTVSKSKEFTFNIQNIGNDNLIINSMKIVNDASGVFKIKSGNSTDPIVPNQNRSVVIEFSPKALMEYGGILQILSNDKNSSELSINLSGKGIVPMLWNKNATFKIINFAHSSKLMKQPAGKQTVAWADDFTVPAGKTWEIETLGAVLVDEIASANSYQFTIFGDKAGLPNAKDVKFTYNFTNNTAPPVEQIGNILADIKNSKLVLGEGQYWISFYGIHNNGKVLTTGSGYNEMTYWCCEEIPSGIIGKSSSALTDSCGLLVQNFPSPWGVGSYNQNLPVVNMAFSIMGKTGGTDVEELYFKNGSISAYPNPANNNIIFTVSTEISDRTIEIYSANGELVETIECFGSELNLNIANYLTGAYYYQLKGTNNDVIGTGKFIKN